MEHGPQWNLHLTVLYFFVLTLGDATVWNEVASPQKWEQSQKVREDWLDLRSLNGLYVVHQCAREWTGSCLNHPPRYPLCRDPPAWQSDGHCCEKFQHNSHEGSTTGNLKLSSGLDAEYGDLLQNINVCWLSRGSSGPLWLADPHKICQHTFPPFWKGETCVCDHISGHKIQLALPRFFYHWEGNRTRLPP